MFFQLFKGIFFYCEGPDSHVVKNKSQCLELSEKGNRWVNHKYNFDNLGQALMSLFVLSSKDGWVSIMYQGLDAVGPDQQVNLFLTKKCLLEYSRTALATHINGGPLPTIWISLGIIVTRLLRKCPKRVWHIFGQFWKAALFKCKHTVATIWAAFVKFGQIFIPKFGHPASGYIFLFQMEEENTKKN